ncbi:hypothetical protein FHS43_001022 [Streptosporangium becharense]|uniref:Glycosyltransferase RgtA/B/C/D-like domain-containing protein n=1 Tax=Streptosporangium becharense TaxID=1816182 RepID=A0A7W9MGD7_9ACTN|nr:hypothetical protein [Streptosporangium becharense]MBB2909776.1 hypothetical protein [Streptosporangium becharense]MBB5819268.1 hypothetical protein [Streptosporangium becharense]
MRAKRGETAGRFASVASVAPVAPAVLGLLLGLLALGPALGPGFVLRYDMVFVPDPPLTLPGEGFPRSVPSDLVVALLAQAVPAQVVQKAVLLGVFVLAASGAAALVPSDRLGPRLAAAAFYAWNTYLAQRLLLGQWALLLGVAALPWAVRAVVLGGRLRLVAALLPAAAGGFQAMLLSALTVLATAVTAPAGAVTRLRRTAEAGVVLGALSLPWLVPALLSGASTDPAGVTAFAARADGPFGTVGSLLSLGGVWNAHAVVPGQQGWWSASVRLVLAGVAVWGFVRLRGGPAGPGPAVATGMGSAVAGTSPAATAGVGPAVTGGPAPAVAGPGLAAVAGMGPAVAARAGLAVAAGAGLAVALAGAFAPGVLGGLIAWWPGFGPFRDGQLYLAPFALLQAVGLAGAVAGWHSRAVAAVAVAVPVLVLPTFALGAFGRLAAVDYPGEWRRVQAIVNADPAPGALLSLPWGAHRAFAWNGGRVVLDPATKMFARPVVWNDALVVGLPGGGRLRLAAESPRAARAEAALRAGPDLRARALAGLGIRYVLEQSNENKFYDGVVVFQGRELRLLRLSGSE